MTEHRDNYLLLRHLAALLVLYGHCYALTAHAPDQADLIARAMPGFYAGNFAIYLFFAISGYLVTLSLLRNPDPWRYARHRVLRVYPAYLVCLLVSVFGIGAAFTTLPLPDYLHNEQTWLHVLRNLKVMSLSWRLPGVFEHNPYPRVVNGSLWSLGLEVRWYVYLGALSILTVVRRRWAFTAIALAVLAYGAYEWCIGKPDINHYRALSQTFLIAALCAQWRRQLPVAHWPMLMLAVAAAVAHGSHWFGPVAVLAAIYFTLWFAYRLPALAWPADHDYSYGLFLYGFPIQQAIVSLFPGINPLQLLPVAALTTTGFAALSWHWIERPLLSRNPRAAAMVQRSHQTRSSGTW